MRPSDPLRFDYIRTFTQTCCIENMQGHAVDVDALADDVAGGSREWGHDGRVISRQPVEQTRLARIGPSRDDHRHSLAQQAPLSRALLDRIEVVVHGPEALLELAVGQEVDLLLREIDCRLDVSAQVDHRVGQPAHHGGELTLQRAHGGACRLARAGVDEVGDRLCLREVQLVVEERALREFPRQGAPRAELRHPRHQRLEHQRSAVAVQLEDVLAGVGMRPGEEEREAGIDRLLRGIEEASEAGAARQRQLAEQYGGDLGDPRTRDADDPDPASSGRGGRRHDGIGAAHADEATAGAAPVEERLVVPVGYPAASRATVPPMEQLVTLVWGAVLIPRRRLMFHCCATPRMVFVT